MTKILIAEDNATNRELFRELLEARGYSVVEACDGQEALQVLHQTQPDILLLDIGMPILDGFAVVSEIRKDPNLTALPILGVTAYAMQGDRERILSSGFDGYLSKPIDAKLLAAELERLLTQRPSQAAGPKPSEAQPSTSKHAASVTGSDHN
jgi:CheY-like chemotaxis protein